MRLAGGCSRKASGSGTSMSEAGISGARNADAPRGSDAMCMRTAGGSAPSAERN